MRWSPDGSWFFVGHWDRRETLVFSCEGELLATLEPPKGMRLGVMADITNLAFGLLPRGGERPRPVLDRTLAAARLRDELAASGVAGRWVDHVASTAVHAISLVPRSTGRSGAAGTRLGGRPALPAGVSWPKVAGAPLPFLLQVDLAEIAEANTGLPSTGLLSVFADWINDHVVVLHVEGATKTKAWPAKLDAEHRYEPVPLVPVAVLSTPELYDAHVPGLDAATAESLDRLRPPATHQLFGHPTLEQADPRERDDVPSVLLLQIESEPMARFEIRDGGRLHLWITPDDLAAFRFDRVVMTFDMS